MAQRIYKKALIIGATSGIGQALAAKLIADGTYVIVCGRRQDRLDAFVAEHKDTGLVSSAAFDVLKVDQAKTFADSIYSQHPDTDCIVLNSGIQRSFNFAYPESVDVESFEDEFNTNYTACVHLTLAFLPHLQKLSGPAHLVYISATLAIVPAMIRTLGYNASKAALHNFILGMREQLNRRPDNNVKVVEVFPPAVQTELHDTRHQPDLKDGHLLGMPLDQYTDEMYSGLQSGKDQFGVGAAKTVVDGVEAQRVEAFHKQMGFVEGLLSKYLA